MFRRHIAPDPTHRGKIPQKPPAVRFFTFFPRVYLILVFIFIFLVPLLLLLLLLLLDPLLRIGRVSTLRMTDGRSSEWNLATPSTRAPLIADRETRTNTKRNENTPSSWNPRRPSISIARWCCCCCGVLLVGVVLVVVAVAKLLFFSFSPVCV